MNWRRPDGHQRQTPSWADRLIEAGALFLLVFTPLAYGTVEPWSEAMAELVVLVMALMWILRMLLDRELRIELPPGWLPAMLFLALILLQAVPLPSGLVEWVSPWLVHFHQMAVAQTGTTLNLVPFSLDPHATWREGLKLLAVAVFFLVVYNTYRSRAQIRRGLWTMVIMGTLISLLGVVQRMTWNGRFYWIGPEAPHANAFGPFVNRAHFAGLMVVVVPMALALMLAARPETERPSHASGWLAHLRRWNSREAGPTRLIPWLILLMGGAALVSGSRGGMVALTATLLLMVGLGAQGRSNRGRAARLAVAAILIILAGIWIGADIFFGTIERLAEEVGRPNESLRVGIWADAVGLWHASPLVGTGYATFEVVFPVVRRLPHPVVFTHAESDWVQLLTDTGAVGLLLALGAAGTLGLALLRCHRHAADRWARAVALAGLVALVGTAIQGIANYNLPVMSNYLYLAAVFAWTLRTGDALRIAAA